MLIRSHFATVTRAVLFIVVSLGLTVSATFAQRTAEPPDPATEITEAERTELVDVEFDEYVVNLPDTWLVWKMSDYRSYPLGIRAATELYAPVGFTYAEDMNAFRYVAFASIRPELVDEEMIEFLVFFYTREEVASYFEVSEDSVTFADYAEMMEVDATAENVEFYDRPALIEWIYDGTHTKITTHIEFAETDSFAIVEIIMPNRFYETVPVISMVIATSLRLNGEEFNPANGVLAFELFERGNLIGNVDCTIFTPNSINLREGPGTNFAVFAAATGGLTADVIGQTVGSDGVVWWKLPNGAWVRSDVVTEDGNCDDVPEME